VKTTRRQLPSRRGFLRYAAAAAGAVAFGARSSDARPEELEQSGTCAAGTGPSLPKVQAQPNRIIAVTVCTRPFRAQGPRIEAERLGRKLVVHNYGHGGSGWSLSWGSSAMAVDFAKANRARELAVIGCGALGLTSALLAQRAGFKVRIYAKDRPPEVRSTFATGHWSPSSRFCTAEHATPEVTQRWEQMARTSFRTFQNMLGLAGDPIEWRDGYYLRDEEPRALETSEQTEPSYAGLDHRLRDLVPFSEELAPGTHAFPGFYVRRYHDLIFNLSSYFRLLVADFLAAGGEIETREFASPSDLMKLREKTLINATGYGARALFGDESLIPVRGQLLRLIPQPEITYGLSYGPLFMLPRRDGIVLQTREGDVFGSDEPTPDRALAERAVQMMAELNRRIC
jgi:glycine/D-amino acid oxidase-like deaminating enzyme